MRPGTSTASTASAASGASSRRPVVGSLLAGGAVLAGTVAAPAPAPAVADPVAAATARAPSDSSATAHRVLGHGSWTAHSYVLTDPSPSTYTIYGRIAATERHDYAHILIDVRNDQTGSLIRLHNATCEGNETCIDTRTVTSSFSQGGSTKRAHFQGCAHDGWPTGGHGLGSATNPGPKQCHIQREYNFEFLGAHEHFSVPFS